MKSRSLLAVVVALGGLTMVAAEASAQDAPGPLLSRDVLFGNPTRVSPKLSPDGTRLSFLAPVDGVLNVWVGPAAHPDRATPVTTDARTGIRVYQWAYTNEHILFLQDDDGEGHWRLYSVNLKTGTPIALTPASSTVMGQSHRLSPRIQHVSHRYAEDIVIALNDRDPNQHDLYVANISTGELIELHRNEGFLAMYTDDDYSVRMASRGTADGGTELVLMNDEGEWERFTVIGAADRFSTGVIGFDETGNTVYMIDSRGRDTASLKQFDIATGTGQTIAKDRDADISGGVLLHPTTRVVQAASSTYERREWHIIDQSVKNDFKYLESVADGELSILSRTLDDTQWIVAFEQDAGPVRYYRYDRPGETAHFLFTSHSELDGLPLARMHSAIIKTRDRRSLVSYYTLPRWTDPRGKGRPDTRLPMVLWVHGGPWSRDYWGYNAVHQWLANRGYAVLSVNYRGSSGFGKDFMNAGDGEWGGKMHDDLVDAVKWAVKKKIADKNRIAIMGGSYGGYATLVALTTSPEKFACGIDIVGPSNLVTFLNALPAGTPAAMDMWARRVGDFRTEEGRMLLTQRSPLTHVEQITRPLLIGQGGADPRVRQSESAQIVETLKRNGIPVTYVVYPDEGHGFAHRPNRLSFYAVAEAFLGRHLGGRVEPIGSAFDGSSITIPTGRQHIAAAMP